MGRKIYFQIIGRLIDIDRFTSVHKERVPLELMNQSENRTEQN